MELPEREFFDRAALVEQWGNPAPSPLTTAVTGRLAQSKPLLDLITANPGDHGFVFDPRLLAEIFARALKAAGRYNPDARGQPIAREAVAAYHGNGAQADQVLLTPGTSMGYYYLFRLLGQPGDEILCPSPTYPLFDDLATLAGLRVRRYHLRREAGPGDTIRWAVDRDELQFQVTPRTCAIVLVSPHNPTGTIADERDLQTVISVANASNLPIIQDEVFREHIHLLDVHVGRVSEHGARLSITLNGLSKMLTLPGIKAGWMVVEGDPALRRQLLAAAEYLSDALLPVSELTQAAMPALLRSGAIEAARFTELIRGRMRQFIDLWTGRGLRPDVPQAGPYLCLPLNEKFRGREEALALSLVKDFGILTHPGTLYDFHDPCLVTTCVHAPPWNVEPMIHLLK